MNNKPMLNAYPDSLGGKLSDIAALLKKKEMQDTFSSFYILPSLYPVSYTHLDVYKRQLYSCAVYGICIVTAPYLWTVVEHACIKSSTATAAALKLSLIHI